MDSKVFLKMEYLELPDGSTSFLHSLKNRNTLWEINNKPQMYEVEIINENIEDFDKNIDDLSNMNKVHCSICNLDVPKLYQKQHNQTSIHLNLLKLTDEVLERTKKHLKTENEQTYASLNITDTFFCEICSKIIQNDDSYKHLESKYHKKKEIFDKLLNFFVEAYIKVNNDVDFELEDAKDFIECNVSSLSKNPSETAVSKQPSDVSKDNHSPKKDPVINIFDPNYLKELLESGRKESYSMEGQNLASNLSTSTESLKSEPIEPDLGPKDTKSEHSVNQTNLNPMNPNFNPMNPNFNLMNPNFNPMNPNFNPMNPNFNPMNPNFHPNFNQMNSNWNQINPNVNFMNQMQANWNPMNPYFNSNSMNPNFNAINPNFNNIDPRFKMHPNPNPIIPNSNPINPNSNLINPSSNPMKPQHKLGPNLNPMDSKNKTDSIISWMPTVPPPKYKFDSNISSISSSSQSKSHSNSNLNKLDPISKSSSNPNLNTSHTQFELNPDLKPITTKKLIKAETKRERQMIIDQKFEDFSLYIKLIQEKYPKPGYKVEAVSNFRVKLTALNGDSVVVKRRYFHSIDRKYCRICQNGNLGRNHEMCEEHISRIMVPVADRNCIREIDDIWSHCIICNELIKFVEDHNKSGNHIKKLQKCFINITKPKENQLKSVSEEVKEKKDEKRDSQKKALFDVDKFSNTLADKLLPLFAKYKSKDGNDNNNGTVDSENMETVEVAKENNKEIKEHILNKDERYESFNNEVSNDSNTKKYCSVCRIHVADFETHKTSNTHADNTILTKDRRKIMSRNNLKEIKDKIDMLKCHLCGINFNYQPKYIEEHINSQNHKRNYFEFIGYNKIILIDQIESQCEPCNKFMPRNNIFDHCNQEKHLKKLKDLINITNNQTKAKKDKKKKQSDDKIPINNDITKLLYQFRAQDVEYLCKTCHVLVARDATSVKTHIESKQHVDKYNILLNSNKVYKTSGSFYCEVCNAQVPMTGEIAHVYGKNHIDNVVIKTKDGPKTEKAKGLAAGPSTLPVASTSKTSFDTTTEMKIPLYIKYQYKDLSETQKICLICEQKVSKSELTNHVLSTTHNLNFNMCMMNNTIKTNGGNMYFCVSCSTAVPIFGEIQHIFGKSHLNKNKNQPVTSKGMLTYDHVLTLTQGKRMVKY